MPKNTVWWIIAALFFLVALLGVYKIFLTNKQSPGPRSTAQTGSTKQSGAKTTVRITKDGFLPEEITISKGDTVVWVNDDTDYHWPASDLHPTHEIYPEFDPTQPVSPGESWSFTFEKVGTWRYHDHLRPNKKGTVTVQKLP